MDKDRLPTGLWVDAHLHTLTAKAIYFYFVQKGNHASGLVLLKINNLAGHVKLLTQERNFDTGKLEWANALEELNPEPKADEYIRRAIARDPDLWVIEIEDPALNNPFSGG